LLLRECSHSRESGNPESLLVVLAKAGTQCPYSFFRGSVNRRGLRQAGECGGEAAPEVLQAAESRRVGISLIILVCDILSQVFYFHTMPRRMPNINQIGIDRSTAHKRPVFVLSDLLTALAWIALSTLILKSSI